ncbi:U3 small nucleolar RNA-associated protein 4 like [Pseudolycoriella hygida]|uniref:U3 small nucleolar RNA-associated protein 4 like n=1 Tax=Pseudolycoriella hygida TaxID=35572 RepID=A0A9Q0N802_9DIPT|nr:U3 small nucleolar RNA-associated protein 4 like [Pseudolycoriella hygida]
MRYAVYMEKCILGQPSSSVEGLGWLNDRLFTTGHTGELTEWDLNLLKPKQTVSLTGMAALCMDIDEQNSCIAVGMNDGYINTFSVDGDDINHKYFDKQDGKILCCKYNATGSHIVTGSEDIIRIWDASTGHALHRMRTSRSEKNRETNVWSLVVLKDLTIIAGDSRGCITVWNGNNGTLIEEINALDADVLAVAVNEEETMFCCSGVDPKIKIFVPVAKSEDSQRRWIANLRRRVHDHDVTSLTFAEGKKIISGGTDGFISVSCSNKERGASNFQYGPFLPQPCAVVAPSSRLLLLKYFNHLEVWKLGRPSENLQLSDECEVQRKFLSMDENVEMLVLLKSKRLEPITCASLSPDGSFLVYSTASTVSLFKLNVESSKKPSMANVKVVSSKFTPCAKVAFSSDSKTMFCVKNNGDVEVFSLTHNGEIELKETISTNQFMKDTISLVCLSKCNKYLICADVCGIVAVWKCAKNRWAPYKNLPNRNYPPTAIAIHGNRIVLAFPDYKIFEYDLETHEIVCSTADDFFDNIPPGFRSTTDKAINNIILDGKNENVVILHNDSFLFVLEKDKELASRIKRKANQSNGVLSEYYKLKTHVGNYEHFLELAWLSPNEIVAVTVSPVTLIEQLPPSLKLKEFGIS